MTKTDVFRMPMGQMMREVFVRYGQAWLWGLGALILAGIFLGIFLDLRWIAVALMVLLIITPFVMVSVVVMKGTHPQCVFNCAPHYLEYDDSSVTVYMTERRKEESRPDSDTVEEEEKPWTVVRTYKWDIPRGARRQITLKGQIISLEKGFVWIPALNQ